MPKDKGGRPKENSSLREEEFSVDEKPRPKLEVAADMGFNKNQVAQFQKLADNPNAVQQAIDYAEKNNTIATRDDAIIWIIKNQFGRRNLSAYDRSILALKLKPVIAAKAKEKMLAGVKPKDPEQIFAQGAEPKQEETVDDRKTNAQIAEQAGVSRETIRKVEKIEEKATPEIKAALKAGEISINEGYKAVKSGHTAREMNAILRPCSTARKIPRNFLNVANQP